MKNLFKQSDVLDYDNIEENQKKILGDIEMGDIYQGKRVSRDQLGVESEEEESEEEMSESSSPSEAED